MQRQSHIERVQMLESLERLKTFGGKPDATLMAMLGDSWNTESVPEPLKMRLLPNLKLESKLPTDLRHISFLHIVRLTNCPVLRCCKS
jgi:hypothetical protein